MRIHRWTSPGGRAARRAGVGDWRLPVAFVGGIALAMIVGARFPGLQPSGVANAEPRAAAGADGAGAAGPVADALRSDRRAPARRWEPSFDRIDARLQAAVTAHVDRALDDVARASKRRAGRSDCRVSLLVVDASDGHVIASREPDRSLTPASNLKLVTTLAALELLGADWAFRTTVEAHGDLAAGQLNGDLVVRAGGDPLYRSDDPQFAARRIDELAGELAARGLRRVSGDLVLDLGSFPAIGPGPGWPSSSASWTGSYGYVAGLSANGGLVDLGFEADAGGAVRTTVAPQPNGLREEHSVRTASGQLNDVRIGLYDSSARLTTSGELGPAGATYARDIRHPDPPAMFAALMRDSLAERGVVIDGDVRRASGLPSAAVLAQLTTPWVELLAPINRDSVNSVADAVFLALGGATRGEWSRGAARSAVVQALEGLGVPAADLQQVGGSGLSRDNRVTARMVVELLRAALAQPAHVRALFLDSLAVAGRSGTLSRRMTGGAAEGNLRGKTGFIQGASALSGVVRAANGRDLAFSILVEYPRISGLNTAVWKPMHDAIGEELAEWNP